MSPAPVLKDQERGFLIPIGGAEDKEADRRILSRFVELSGSENGDIVVIPTASRLDDTGPNYLGIFDGLGIGQVDYLPINSREDCDNPSFFDVLDRATGIFITGGNQLRLSTILGGTLIAQKIRRCNAAGIPIAGTSAGASIMSEHMIAGGDANSSPSEDGVNLAPGLGLTNAAIIDQHFTERHRLGRLLSGIAYNPFLLGIGIDEDTGAFIGPDNMLEVVGKGSVTIADAKGLTYSSMGHVGHGEPLSLLGLKLDILAEGCRYDLDKRQSFPPESTTE
ncbi:MAG: cyanophycinase [Rhodospirillales bacterium]|jgi:cyanophycinase|nr:cyanophycinase [Rhodospirillales bacterium]